MRSNTAAASGPPRLFIALLYGIPALAVLFGVIMIFAGIRQAPHDDAAAQTFRADPSCGADLAAAAALRGLCQVSDATIERTGELLAGGPRSASKTLTVDVRLADGRRFSGGLAGADGASFAQRVYPGMPGRAQLFRGRLVRVSASGVTAELTSAPDVMAWSDAMLPWAGAFTAAIGLLLLFIVSRTTRRLRARAP